MSKDKIVKGGMKLASKFKSDLRQQHKDLMSYPDAGEIASLKRRGGDSPSKSINNAFNYIEKSKTPAQAKSRSEEMFGEFDLDTAIEEAGGFDKAFKVKPVKKKMGGIVKAAKKVAKKVVKEATDTPKKKLSNKSKAEMAAAGATVAAVGLATSKADKKKKEVKSKKPKGKELSARPLLAATQRRIDYERAQKAKNNKEPEKKAGGGMMKKKGYAKGGAVRKQSKPRGVGAATRGYGRAMR